jgi:hypothetical protein
MYVVYRYVKSIYSVKMLRQDIPIRESLLKETILKYYTTYILIRLIFNVYVTVTLVTLFSLLLPLRQSELLDARKRAM